VVFSSGEPTGLSSSLPGVLTQLPAVISPHAPVLLGFDRGGAFPVTFTACRDAGADWVTYRRAPLAETTATPRKSWTIRDGKRVTVMLTDESVQLNGYGAARQLTLFEHDQPVLQVLTSDTTGTGADLLCWLRSRWRIENTFKYASEHNGIDALADYAMDIGPNTQMVANPARVTARKHVNAAEAELVAAEPALPQLLNGQDTPETEERRAARRTRPDPARPDRAGRREDRPGAHPGQGAHHRAGPGRDTRPSAAAPPRPANGAAAAHLQRRSLARRTPQRLPSRPRRVPSHHPQPAPPRRPRPVRQHRDHHHPGPARLRSPTLSGQ